MSASITFTKFDNSSVTDLLSSEVITSRIQGVESSAEKNIQTLKLTNGDGEKVISSDYATRPITQEGKIVCSTPTALRTKLEALKRDVSGKGYLDVTFEGGSTRRYTVEVKNWVVTNAPYNLSWVPFAINFEAIDSPFGEDVTSTVLYSADGITSDIELVSDLDGSADPSVSAQIAIPTIGSLTGLEFRNLTTNTGVLLQPTFAANDTVSINTGRKSCLLNGLPVDFSGQVPTFVGGDNDWRLNFLTSSITIDTQQTIYTTEKFIFGDTWFAQSFQATGAIKAHRIDLMLNKFGNPTSVKVDIYTNTSGHPASAITGATATISGTNIPLSPGYVSFYLQNVTSLSAATTYWIVVQATGATNDIDNGFYIKASNLNSYGTYGLSSSSDSGFNWSAISNADAVFRLWKTPVLVANTDITEESYSESFATTTNKDAVNTTASWDTANTKLITGTATGSNTGFLSPTAHPGAYLTYDNFTNPANAYVADGSFATHTTDLAAKTADDSQTYQNFNFGVQSGSVVTGFDIKVKGKVDSGTAGLDAYLVFDRNNDGVLNVTDLSAALSAGASSFTLTSTNTEYTLSGTGGAWLGANVANGLCTLWLNPTVGSKTYSLDLVQVKIYYSSYDLTKNVGQSGSLSVSTSLALATARMAASETLPTSTTIDYALQNDATNGFVGVTNNVTSDMPITALGTAPAHKWKATLNGTTSSSPSVNDLAIYYRGAMQVGATTDRLAQSFASGVGGSISGILLNLVKTISDTIDYTIEIHPDSAGSPSGTPIANGTATLLAANVANQATGDSFSWVTASFASAPSLTAATTYWLVIKVGTAGSSKLLWRARGSNSYSSGTAKYSVNSGSAYTTLTNQDFLFQILSSGATFSADVDISYKSRSL
jgi:hypothetical protein